MFRSSKIVFFRYIPGASSCNIFNSFMEEKRCQKRIYTLKKVTLIIGNEMDLSLMMALIERYPNA